MKKNEEKSLTQEDLVSLTLGQRPAVTPKEKALLKEIKEIKRKGLIVEIPKEFL